MALSVAGTANSGNVGFRLARRIGRGTHPPHARQLTYSYQGHSAKIRQMTFVLQRAANLQFPDTFMSRHNAGEQAVAHQKLFPVSAVPSHDPKRQAFTEP